MKEKLIKLKSNKLAFTLTIFTALLIVISLGSAILSSTLNIGGKSKIKENSWIIYFDEIRDIYASNPYNVKPTITDLGKTHIEFDAKLDQPGDVLEFYVDTVNDGTIDAQVESIEKFEFTEEQQKYLEFRVIDVLAKRDIRRCDYLRAGERRLMKVIVRFKEGLDLDDYPSEPQELNLFFDIHYVQPEIDGCETIPNPKRYKLTILPNGGVYEKRTTPTIEALEENEEYTTKIPTRKLYNFDGWEVVTPNGEGDYDVVELTGDEDFEFNPINDIIRGNWLFKMGTHDTYIRAKWIENDYVARIEDTYYTTIQAAFDSVDGNNPKTGRPWSDNTVWLLRDTTEYPSNEAHDAFIFNLDAHTVTGSITNVRGSNITMVNGRVETEKIKTDDDEETKNKKKYAFKNYGILNVGIDEGIVEVENSIALVGNSAGLYTDSNNGAEFNFYDGYLEGISGFIGEYNDTPTNYFVFSEHRNETNRERVYLVRDPSRAVAKTYVNGVVYRYNLQDAFNAVELHQSENGKEREKDYKVDAIRNFEAAYPLSINRNTKVVFDLVDYTVRTGDSITNNGDLDIVNTREERAELKPSVAITNNGNLNINNVNLTATADKDVIINKGALKVEDSTIHTDISYGIKNINHGTVELNDEVVLKSEDSCGLYNSSDSLEITAGKIYCFINEGTATVSGSNTEYITFLKKTQPDPRYPEYNPAIRNSGTINFNNGKVTTNYDTSMIFNSGTFNFTDGLIHSEYLSVNNSSGTFNVKGSELTSTRTPISGGTVNVNGGNVHSDTTYAINGSTVNVRNGQVYTDNGIAIAGSSSVNVYGGTVTGTTTAINISGSVNMSGGLVTSPDKAIDCSSFTSSGGQVISQNDTAVVCSSANIKGTARTDLDEQAVLVIGKTNGIITNNFTMTGGKVTSTDGIGVTIKSSGNITGGFIEGDTYGVLSKGTLTLGADDENITSETPVLMGELYGLYIEGDTTNFFDGIVKGQVDGYYGPITGTPLGGVVFEGEEDLEKVSPGVVNHYDTANENTKHYETDFIDRFNDWLRIGDDPYNTLNAATSAVEDGGEATIIVTRDADILFAQKFIDANRNKHITLDLNGHTITTTQNITNYTNLTIIDSSKDGQVYSDTGSGPGTIKIKKNDGIINEQLMVINGGRYESITNQVLINKVSQVTDDTLTKGIIINDATFSVNKYVIQNGVYENSSSRHGYVIVNGIKVESSKTFINNSYGTNVINGTKNNTTGEYTTEIHSSDNAFNNEDYVVINGGYIDAGNRVVYGEGSVTVNETKNINLDDDNQVAATYLHSNDRVLSVHYYGSATVNGGTLKSENATAMYGEYYLTVNGGHVEGTVGLYNTCHTISWWNMCIYGDVTITGGKIVGTTGNGVTLTGDDNANQITGGEIIGKQTGVANDSDLIIGTKGGELNIESPILRGIDQYGLTNTKYGYIRFYDGILMGKLKANIENSSHNGLISEVEDATMVVRDFKFIDRVEYQTEYLRTQGDWLQVGDKTFNTTDKASAAVTAENNTIYVIADTHIAFKEAINSDHDINFDLNGHSVTFTQSIDVRTNTHFVGTGSLHNKRTTMLSGSGRMIFDSGSYSSERDNAVYSSNYLLLNGGTFHSDESAAIQNNGTMIYEDGEITATEHYAVDNNGNFTMNHGEIKNYGAIDNDGIFTIKNNARIEGTHNSSIANAGTINVQDDAVVYNEYTNAISSSCGLINIDGGTTQSTATNAVTIGSSTACGSTTIYVNDGLIDGKTNGLVNTSTSNHIYVTGGHIIGRNNNGLNTTCTTSITGGLIEGNAYGVYVNDGTTTIGEDEGGIPRIDSPVLKGGLYGLYISNPQQMTVNFYDGILKGQTWGHYNDVTNIPDRTNIVYGTETIDDELYQTAYLFKEGDIARNTRTDVIYNNLQDAINEAEAGDTVELINNVPLFYQLINENNVILDLNGHFISTNKNITNRGVLKIVNSADTESKIETSLTTNLITNLGTLEVDNVTLRNVSASYYVINSTGETKLNNTKIDSIYGVSCSNKLTIINSNIKATQTAINNTGELTINGGTYQGGSYSVYSNTARNISVTGSPVIDEETNIATDSDTIFKGTFYTTGNNNAYLTGVRIDGDLQTNSTRTNTNQSVFNGRYYASGGISLVENSTFNRSLTNSSTLTVNNSHITGNVGEWVITSGTTNINNSKIDLNSSQSRCSYWTCYPYDGIENSGTLIFDNSKINIDKTTSLRSDSRGIYNTGTVKLLNNTVLDFGMVTNTSSTYRGILTAGSGNTIITDSRVNVVGGSTAHGVYIDNTNASTTITTGEIQASGAPTTYGAYINTGTFTMGEYDGRGIDGIVDIENPNPNVISSSASRGIGVKKINGSFNFYDGKILASKFTKPETTTHVEYNYEVTTYVDEETGYEYAWLEFMLSDYEGETVAKIGDTHYRSVQDAINKVEPDEEILLLKSTAEDLTVNGDRIVKINLNNHSITTHLVNEGSLQIYNGSLQNFDLTTVVNNGTLIMGKDDGTVSSTNVRIVSEVTPVINNGTFKMYDGYLEGNPSLEGSVNEIAQYARLHTKKDSQSEKKYLQSLSPEAIMAGETDLILTINPNGGIYEGSKEELVTYLKYQEEYELATPTKNACDFIGWEVSDDVLTGNIIKMNVSDVIVTAKWEVSERAIAKVGNEYFESLQEALDYASDNNLVELIKDTTEDITNNSNVTLDLGGHKVTGAFINNGILKILNGEIENPDGVGIVNNKSLNLGENDGDVSIDYVRVLGTTVGIEQNGRFNFYDGFIEGDVALIGKTDSVPKGYFLYNERDTVRNQQKVYLIGNPENAVAVIEDGGTQYFFSLQDAINTANVINSEIFIVRDFEATYPITVPEGADILINMNSYNITTGNNITNNGTLRIYDTSETFGSITSARTIENNGNLTIEGITIKQNSSSNNAIYSETGSTLKIKGATIEAKDGNAVANKGTLTLEGDYVLKSNTYGLANSGNPLTIDGGTIYGLYSGKDLTIEEGANIIGNGSGGHSGIVVNAASTLTVNGGTISSPETSAIINTVGNVNVIVNGGTISGKYGLNCDSGTANYVVNGGTISASGSHAIYMYKANCNLEVNGGDISSTTNSAIYFYNNPHKVKITGGYIHNDSSGGYAINYDYGSSNSSGPVEITGGLLVGNAHGVRLYGSTYKITGGEIKTTSTNNGHYALYADGYSGGTIEGDVFFNAPNASGLWVTNTVVLKENARVYAGHTSARGMYTYGSDITIQDSAKIETPGTSAYGILLNENNNAPKIYINGGEIISGNIGIHTNGQSSAKTIYVNAGKIEGKNYGIYMNSSGATINMGSKDEELSTEVPFVTGGLYGIYKTTGNMNFYNGRLRGYTYGYNDYFNNVLEEHEIAKTSESSDEVDYMTYSTTNVSGDALANTAKIGNGYAKITYIGETTDTCVNGTTYTFDATSNEETFSPTCAGTYKLEVWGAQGGSNSSNNRGGYGGYSTGEINLEIGEILYINVGTQPTTLDGGYNGGGTAGINYSAKGGGGATHIATHSGLLSTLENNKSSVLIVAGGGGGADSYSNGSSGGEAGGYIGNNGSKNIDYDTYVVAKGGSQTAGGAGGTGACTGTSGSFGQGGSQCSNHGGGGGAGWYGGGGGGYNSGVVGSGAGGSGYVGSRRLTNKSMYGYNVKVTHEVWINNFLVTKEDFIQVGENTYNSINKAQAAIETEGTGTMILLKDVEVNELSTIAANKNVTFDLNGHVLTITRGIVNYSNLTIVDSSTNKTGKLDGIKTNTIATRGGSLTVDGTYIKSVDKAIYVADASTTITVNNSTLEGAYGIYSDIASTEVDVDDSTITATTTGIYLSKENSTITIDESNISGKSRGIYTGGYGTNVTLNSGSITSSDDIGLYLGNYNSSFIMNNGTITSKNQSIYTNGSSNIITINNGTVTSTNYDAIMNNSSYNTNSRPTITINNGLVQGARYGAYIYYAELVVNGGEIKTTANSRDNYAIFSDGWGGVTIKNDGFVNAPNASGIRTGSGLTIKDNARIYAGASNAYGIYSQYLGANMTGGSIEAPGKDAYAVYSPSTSDFTFNLKGGTISAGNTGIRLENSNSNTRVLNVTGGSIIGGKYGIYQTQNYTTTIGDSSQPVSTLEPYITGGQYAIYKTSGTVNFYSGKLRGYHNLNKTMFTDTREKMKVATDTEIVNNEIAVNTLNTYEYSDSAESNKAKSGNGYARITYLGLMGETGSLETAEPEIVESITCQEHVGQVYTYSAIKNYQELDIDCAGTYKVELWGAQGGFRSSSAYGGNGGYTSGLINFQNRDHIYIMVGSSGNNGGYNGGGTRSIGHGGGGATDIRLDVNDLYSRIAVAAGGGSDGASSKPGGYGGGTQGQSRSESYGSGGYGASQTAAGEYRGTFGIGGSGGEWSGGYAGAGGAGWYGGGGANPDGSGDDDRGGGGGSSFAYTSTSTVPTGYNVDARFQMSNIQLLAGNQTIPTHSGEGEMTGNIGNGYAKITFIEAADNSASSASTHDITLETSVGELDENLIEYNAGDRLGTLPIPEVDNDNYIFDGYYLDKDYTRKVTENTIVASSATLYAKFKFDTGECNTLEGTSYDFRYVGEEEKFQAYCPGVYELEVWGAQGGRALCDGAVCGQAGYGGYSKGKTILLENQILFVNVGGQGATGSLTSCAQGGYNGGGKGINDGGGCGNPNDNEAAGGGGGATHIATKSGLLSSLENNKDKILIVAGGGGGVAWSGTAGSGGGTQGGRTLFTTTDVPTQTTGSAFGQGANGSGNKQPGTCVDGSSSSCSGVAGGGGGYYGGYSQDIEGYSSATGGSGYISQGLTDAIMYQYHMDSQDVFYINYLTDKDGFLEVNGVTYNNFDDAIAAIEEEGTIKVILSTEVQEVVTIPAGKNITLDMNDLKLTMTQAITNQGTLTITNTGTIENNLTNPIINKGNLTVNNTTIKSSDNSAIYGSEGTGTITINGAKLIGYHAINVGSGQRVIINSGNLEGTISGVYINSDNASLSVVKGNIFGRSQGIRNNGQSTTITITGGTIDGGIYGIFDDKSKDTSKRATYNITGGKIIGTSYGISTKYSIVNLTNTEVTTNATGRDYYALYCNDWASCTVNSGTVITAPNASGIYNNSALVINGGEINANLSNSYGIYQASTNTTINNGSINTPGLSSIGIYINNGTTTLNDGNITSGNNGIVTADNSNTKNLNIYGGNIVAKTYGIYQRQSTNLLLGDSSKDVSITTPSIEGGVNGLYSTGGTMSFYSGRLKGSSKAYVGTFNNIKDGYEIFENYDEVNSYLAKDRTYSVEEKNSTATSLTPKEGNGYAKITYSRADTVSNNNEYEIVTEQESATNCNSQIGREYIFESVGEAQVFAPECSGQYKIEVWGAQGGYRSSSENGGKGGYTRGYINLENIDQLYVYVGSSGNNGGYNGGGTRALPNYGGGATDVRTTDSLYSRIIVAGGGGSDGASNKPGGAGGGLTGQSRTESYGSGAVGGGQEAAGDYRGAFGVGGSGGDWSGGHAGAGGGGWYGGGGANPDGSGDDDRGGGGGSSFVYNETAILPTGYIPDAKYKLSNTEMRGGTQTMPSHDGTSEMTGNTGDGYAKITFVKSIKSSTYKVKLISNIGTIENDELRYRSSAELGDIPAPVINDSNLTFEGWFLDQEYTKKIASTYKVKSNLTLYAKFNITNEYCEGLLNEEYTFDYTGTEQSFTAVCPGSYKLETWGAQGGNTTYNSNSNTGGYGGYSTGNITLSPNEKLYIYVGGKGQSITYNQSEGQVLYDDSNGFNGGGKAVYYTDNSSHAGGGGATHIATREGKLSQLYKFKNSIIIVAGGGGGASTHSAYPNYSGDGGSGGGYTGGAGITSSTTCYNYGTGGTQSGGGSYTACANDGRTDRSGAPGSPDLGMGSNYTANASDKVYSGGGAGYYGGQSGYHAPGGGGSGYTGNSRLTNTAMYGYKVNAKYDTDSNIAYLVLARNFVKNVNKDVEYSNLQVAFDSASTGDTLQLLDDNIISYVVSINANTDVTLDLNGHNLSTTKTYTNNGKLNIINSDTEHESKIFSGLSSTLITNNGTINITGVKVEAYNAFDNKKDAVLNITNETITARNQAISNAGELNITTSTISGTNTGITSSGDVIINESTISGNVAVNNNNTVGNMRIVKSNITSSNQAINNTGTLTILDHSVINGTNYAIYSNSIKPENITDSTLISSNTVLYKASTSITTIEDTSITGYINVNNSGGTLNITNNTLTGYIYNNGKINLSNVTINYTSGSSNNVFAIESNGNAVLNGNNINVTSTYNGSGNNYDLSGLYNKGTATSTNNHYRSINSTNVRGKYLVGIQNNNVLTSTNDDFVLGYGNTAATIYNSTSSTATITGLTSETYEVNTANGIYNNQGTLNITNSTFDIHNSTTSRGIYINTGTVTTTGTNYTITTSTNGYGTYLNSGALNLITGRMDISATTTAYGIQMIDGTLTLGVEDGRGTDSADVSITDPYIKAVGTTGIGVSMGNGTFNYYDGYIMGSTYPRAQGDITSATDLNYQVVTRLDEETGYNYCILEFIK